MSKWIDVTERLPRINHNVLLSTTNGEVFVGYRDKPDLIWQVTEHDGRKHWVYDPEAYTDDIDSLPKGEDCGFSRYTGNGYGADGMMSVTSLNYDEKFGGVNAWMPLPKPYRAEQTEPYEYEIKALHKDYVEPYVVIEQTEPQLTPNYCATCKYKDTPFDGLPCDMCRSYSAYEPKDEPQRDCLTCRYNSDEWDSPKCDGCSKAHSNYETQTDCPWK